MDDEEIPKNKLEIKYKCVKLPLKSIIRNKSDLLKINEKVIIHNKIVVSTFQFLKLYLLSIFDKVEAKNFPKINFRLVNIALKLVSRPTGTCRRKSI